MPGTEIEILQKCDIIGVMDISAVLKALANERRLEIVEWLKQPSKHFSSSDCDVEKMGVCVGLIEKKSGLSQSTVSQYLVVLRQAGIITMERCGQWTYCKLDKSFRDEFIRALSKKI